MITMIYTKLKLDVIHESPQMSRHKNVEHAIIHKTMFKKVNSLRYAPVINLIIKWKYNMLDYLPFIVALDLCLAPKKN